MNMTSDGLIEARLTLISTWLGPGVGTPMLPSVRYGSIASSTLPEGVLV
ncbi:hypothetical protein NKJ71_02640 [Mesorhizobium sp. M0050]